MDEQERAEHLNQVVDDLLAERAPTDAEALASEDVDLARVAVMLKSSSAARLTPNPDFVARLGARLSELETPAEAVPAPPPAARAARLPRRRVLGGMAAGLSGLLLGGLGGRTLGEVQAHDQQHTDLQAPYTVPLIGPANGEWVTVAVAGTVPAGGALRFEAGPLIGYLLFDGHTYTAMSAVCTHMGCLLRWADAVFVCPCHGAMYERGGKMLSGPTRHPLPSIQVRVLPATGEVQIYTTLESNTSGTGIKGYESLP